MPRGLILEAITYLEELPRPRPGAPLRAGAAAVIEEANEQVSYWALTHPAPEPDFHHRPGIRAARSAPPPAGVADDVLHAVGNAHHVKFGIDRLLADARCAATCAADASRCSRILPRSRAT